MNKVTVLGSVNLDTTIRMERLPLPGETVHSSEMFSSGGGKGANQAIAAQRSNADTSFIGAVGNDEQGKLLLDLLVQDGIDVTGVQIIQSDRTGSAVVMVDEQAENSIVIYSGANKKINLSECEVAEKIIVASDFLVSQFEINIDAIIEAFKIAKRNGVRTLLNPAPAMDEIPAELLKYTDILIPNQSEAERITGIKINTDEQLYSATNQIKKYGVEVVIITLGSKGSYYMSEEKSGKIPAQVVQAIDTTAAGDTFIGSLAANLSVDFSNLEDAIVYASKASSIAVQRYGAQPSIPYAEEINLQTV
ncbi:ribokinase [Enterococcus sp. 2201sp1_2201st1_B8_2201SCRN_220225]|uniref:ribokinase n=1 Tax=unclassified Enterococcus TaxID=2608891 RepID=UPI0034A582B0